MLQFSIGALVGAIVGVFIMAIMQVNSNKTEDSDDQN